MFYKGEGVLPYMAYSGQPLPQGAFSWLWRQSQGKAPWGRGCIRGSVLQQCSVLLDRLCPKKIYNFAGVCQWRIASRIACTIDLICYMNFFLFILQLQKINDYNVNFLLRAFCPFS